FDEPGAYRTDQSNRLDSGNELRPFYVGAFLSRRERSGARYRARAEAKEKEKECVEREDAARSLDVPALSDHPRLVRQSLVAFRLRFLKCPTFRDTRVTLDASPRGNSRAAQDGISS